MNGFLQVSTSFFQFLKVLLKKLFVVRPNAIVVYYLIICKKNPSKIERISERTTLLLHAIESSLMLLSILPSLHYFLFFPFLIFFPSFPFPLFAFMFEKCQLYKKFPSVFHPPTLRSVVLNVATVIRYNVHFAVNYSQTASMLRHNPVDRAPRDFFKKSTKISSSMKFDGIPMRRQSLYFMQLKAH